MAKRKVENIEFVVTTSKIIGDKVIPLASGGARWVGEAISLYTQDCMYYSLVCGYEVCGRIESVCAECLGRGEVRRQRSRVALAMKTCPSCKGKHEATVIDIPAREITETTLVEIQQEHSVWEAS